MILMLSPGQHPMGLLLSQALHRHQPHSPPALLCLDSTDLDDLGICLANQGSLLGGYLDWQGQRYDWVDLQAAWHLAGAPPKPGTSLDLLLQGLDLSSFHMVGRPSSLERLHSLPWLETQIRAAGLTHPARHHLGASQVPAPEVRTKSSIEGKVPERHEVWRGGVELHGLTKDLYPWLSSIGQLCDSLGFHWGRLSLECTDSGPPCVLAIEAAYPTCSDLNQLPPPAFQAFLGLTDWMLA